MKKNSSPIAFLIFCLFELLLFGCNKDSVSPPNNNNHMNCKVINLISDDLSTNAPNTIDEFFYDGTGKIIRYQNGKKDYRFFYDANGRVNKSSENGYETTYTYDKSGNLTSFKNLEYPEGAVKIISSGEKITQVAIKTNFENILLTYSYDNKGNIIKLTGSNGNPNYIIDVAYDTGSISPYFHGFQSLGACRIILGSGESLGFWVLVGPNTPKEIRDNIDGKLLEFKTSESKNNHPTKVRIKDFNDNDETEWTIQYNCN